MDPLGNRGFAAKTCCGFLIENNITPFDSFGAVCSILFCKLVPRSEKLVCTHTHTHIYVYVYIYMCVCVCLYIYIYISKTKTIYLLIYCNPIPSNLPTRQFCPTRPFRKPSLTHAVLLLDHLRKVSIFWRWKIPRIFVGLFAINIHKSIKNELPCFFLGDFFTYFFQLAAS